MHFIVNRFLQLLKSSRIEFEYGVEGSTYKVLFVNLHKDIMNGLRHITAEVPSDKYDPKTCTYLMEHKLVFRPVDHCTLKLVLTERDYAQKINKIDHILRELVWEKPFE